MLGAAWGRPIQGAVVALVMLGAHFMLVRDPQREACMVIVAAAAGFLLDSMHARLGILAFPGASGSIAPFWIVVLWAQFGSLLRHLPSRFLGSPAQCAALGALGGPAAFWAGSRMGAVAFPSLPLSLAVLAISWGIAVPALAWLAVRLGPGTYRMGSGRT